MAAGILSIPVDLGRFTIFGRAKAARRELCSIIRNLMESPTLSRKNIIADLVQASADGEGFDVDEVVDTVLTLFVAGKVTTADALPALLVQLHHHRDWAAKISEEPLEFRTLEEDSATLRVVRESLRMKPLVNLIRREALDSSASISLGPHGNVPPGCAIAVDMGRKLLDMGSEFDPNRWTREVTRESTIPFGGSQPHSCIGKNLALAELQLFARVLCQEYVFEVLSDEQWVNPQNPSGMSYKDGLRVRVWRKPEKDVARFGAQSEMAGHSLVTLLAPSFRLTHKLQRWV